MPPPARGFDFRLRLSMWSKRGRKCKRGLPRIRFRLRFRDSGCLTRIDLSGQWLATVKRGSAVRLELLCGTSPNSGVFRRPFFWFDIDRPNERTISVRREDQAARRCRCLAFGTPAGANGRKDRNGGAWHTAGPQELRGAAKRMQGGATEGSTVGDFPSRSLDAPLAAPHRGAP